MKSMSSKTFDYKIRVRESNNELILSQIDFPKQKENVPENKEKSGNLKYSIVHRLIVNNIFLHLMSFSRETQKTKRE